MVMTDVQFATLIGLGVVILVAVAVVTLLLRSDRRAPEQRHGMVKGYPPVLFPNRELTTNGMLAELAAIQSRLLTIYEQVPAHSDLAIWLRTFLHELREIMDTSYRVAMIARLYGRNLPLERVVAEVKQIENQLAEHVIGRLLARDADRQQELLAGRLETLRMCVRELNHSAEIAATQSRAYQ